MGRLIPAGTGLAYHSERKRKALEEEIGMSAADAEQALSDALSSSD